MKRIYTVHDAVHGTAQLPATLADGSTVSATVEALNIQLVPETGATIHLAVTSPTDADKALFGAGKSIAVEFSDL